MLTQYGISSEVTMTIERDGSADLTGPHYVSQKIDELDICGEIFCHFIQLKEWNLN